MDAVLLKSLPVADPQQVVYLYTSGLPRNGANTGDYNTSFSYPVYDTLRHNHAGLSDVIVYVPMSFDVRVAVRYGTSPETAEGDMVGGNFFSGLGVKMARGRGFTTQDEDQHAPVTVISYNYWTRRFSRDPDVVGKRCTSRAFLSSLLASLQKALREQDQAIRWTSGFPCSRAPISTHGAFP